MFASRPLITAGPALQLPSHTATPNPMCLSYLPERPAPGSFGIMNSFPTAASTNLAHQSTPTSCFTGDWPVLSTSYAIENFLKPETPVLLGDYDIMDDPMDIDHPEIPVRPSISEIIIKSQTTGSQPLTKKRLSPTNILTIPLSYGF
ncbi:hypothetical protein L211DRAFT_848877 [Terfezia boudieri ATCC MYA-4762]|uniref:Uncharacterized protein n=1 Tax=Terfezia boudieri ATCC MYA-4762 TaxID=1051890 RepID=A0A3N4LNZ3_9PEZI|nr:hypothetical protein L211DRAFT_848877 [Terfezia boudieri ATCC MYA-4762]